MHSETTGTRRLNSVGSPSPSFSHCSSSVDQFQSLSFWPANNTLILHFTGFYYLQDCSIYLKKNAKEGLLLVCLGTYSSSTQLRSGKTEASVRKSYDAVGT